MRAVRQTLIEMVLLTVAATCVALAGNGIRAFRSGPSISLGKNYFDKGGDRIRAVAPAALETAGKLPWPIDAAKPQALPAIGDPPQKHLNHPYQEASFDQVVSIFNDPNTAMGANLFVDARNDDAYADGHISGAIQLDHYQLPKYLENVLYRAQAAEKVIVYCNGGDCEDSIFACADLLDAGIPYDNIYLYAGGWKEWSAKNMPIEKIGSGGGGD